MNFKALLSTYSPAVMNTAFRILQDSQQAQDVHQEVFLEIWRRWHKFNGHTNWGAYIYKTTVRKAIRQAKQQKARTALWRQQELPTVEQEPDERLRAAELHIKLKSALAKLPKRQAQVFVLSRIEGLRAEKIAEILDCSKETVRVHLHRAVKRLVRELGDYIG